MSIYEKLLPFLYSFTDLLGQNTFPYTLQIQSLDSYKHTATSMQALRLFSVDQQKSFSGLFSCLIFEEDKKSKSDEELKRCCFSFLHEKIFNEEKLLIPQGCWGCFCCYRVISYSPLALFSSSDCSFLPPQNIPGKYFLLCLQILVF